MKEIESIRFTTLPSTAFMMASIAGFTDVLGFVGANKIFTAHITGNIVIAISELIHHTPGVASKIVAIPVFIAIVICVTGLIEMVGLTRKMLAFCFFIEALFLIAFMLAGAYILNFQAVDSLSYICATLLAVAAMSIHNALLRIYMHSFPPCTVMTGNLTQIIIHTSDFIWGWKEPYATESRQIAHGGMKSLGNVLLGFLVGATLAALGYILIDFWSVLLPVILLFYMTIRCLDH